MKDEHPPQNLEMFYSDTGERYDRTYRNQVRLFNRISWVRLAVFTGILVSFYFGFESGAVYFIPTLALLAVFIFLIRWSIRVARRRDHYQVLTRINSHEKEAIGGNYSMFHDGKEWLNRNHPYSFDLDIFGAQSLYQYINRSYTHGGQQALGQKLSSPLYQADQIRIRQEAVREMASKTSWRQHYQAHAAVVGNQPIDMNQMMEWIGQPVFRSWLYPFLSWLLPLGFLVLLILSIFNGFPAEITLTYLIIPLMVVGSLMKRTNAFQNGVYRVLAILRKLGPMIGHVEREAFKSQSLQELQALVLGNDRPASRIIRRLGIVSDAFESRQNLIVGIFLNAFILWDIHCLMRFERWKARYGKKIPHWLDALYEFEALSSMGTLAFNHPHFSYPVLTDREEWKFKTMGHPLIPASLRVDNDHDLEGMGRIHIVTGPNMAGKSTFLRAIGTNLVLAQTGQPVCARKMVFKPIQLFTSMRTTDSLQKNESYFYSELKRLRSLFDLEQTGPGIYFLLDEILKGTNTLDQSRGSEAVMERLLHMKVVGIIATHNLSLSEMEDRYPDQVTNYCFEVGHEKDRLKFDYLLRSGVASHMNATALMEEMGLIRKPDKPTTDGD